jgi:ribosomal protein S18 acetylase RimI-like enzyme
MTTGRLRIEWRGESPGPDFVRAAMPGFPEEPLGPGFDAGIAYLGTRPVARVTVCVREGLHTAPGRSGLIGHYAAHEREAGISLLEAAIARLRESRVARVLGPMNGSTWARYRLAMSPMPEAPPFLGEPVNPGGYIEQFSAAGLAPVAHYASTVGPLTGDEPAREAERAERVAGRGVRIAPLRLASFRDELDDLHAFSQRAFADNPYFSPVGVEAFVAIYAPMERVLVPELVLLARDAAGALGGYVLGYPDPSGPGRLVIKTLAVDPGMRSIGLGTHLTHLVRRAAHERGLRQAIHALMHITNDSTRIATDGMQLFRRYALFGLALE